MLRPIHRGEHHEAVENKKYMFIGMSTISPQARLKPKVVLVGKRRKHILQAIHWTFGQNLQLIAIGFLQRLESLILTLVHIKSF